jgi:transcriptional regulator with GAF, ATPase, and Fis domain
MDGEAEIWLEPDRIMELVLESLGDLIDYELAVVLGFSDGDRLRLRVRKARGTLAKEKLSRFELSLRDRPDLAAIIESGGARLLDTGPGRADTYAEVLDLPEGHSCVAAPLRIDGTTVGLLTLDHTSCGVFTAEIVRFLGTIGSLIALALHQADMAAGLRRRNAELTTERNRLIESRANVFESLVGRSPAWIRVIDSIRLVSATEAPVLLLGETGTGKEEAAKALHRLSPRSSGPFITLNCTSIPPGLAESELFGHERGSFTGAHALRRGRFELANGGTLLLDEIGDLPLEIQPKLLRILQEGCFERMGGEAGIRVDVRIVAATHVDLGLAVEKGRFREDLYYRLAVFPIKLPPLRERGQDTILIAEHLLAMLRSHRGWEELHFSAEALACLVARSWPGNVRELGNVVERAAILARGGEIGLEEIGAGDWARCQGRGGISCGDGATQTGQVGMPPGTAADLEGAGSLEAIQREHIRRILVRTRGKLYGSGGAAALLGLRPSTLQSRMKRLGLSRKDFC